MMLGFKIGFLELTWVDALDILFVAFLFFRLYKLLKGGVGLPIFIGMLSFYLLFLLVKTFQMEMLTLILSQVMGVGAVAILVVFQQEIRRFLILFGKNTFMETKWLHYLPWYNREHDEIMDVEPIVEAAKALATTKTGALIVFAMYDGLTHYIESGDEINATISKRLLISIFNKESPLHDGAVILENNKIASARSILPVTQKEDLPASMGLRHRAAYGMSEETDAIIVVVSEETGMISIIHNHEIYDNLSAPDLRKKLKNLLNEKD